MKASLNWLREFVNLGDITPEQLADKLTFAGVEVEEIIRLASGSGLVVGEIISCEKHPDSDHLHVLQVDEGKKYGIQQIVCGAPNARKGLKVIVAMPGAVLPEVTIQKGVIRGIESNGMCCSLAELGVDKRMLSEKQTGGIEELDYSVNVGEENVLGMLGLDDVILDLKLLANRPDMASMENVAKEVAALLNEKEKIKEWDDVSSTPCSIKVSSKTASCPAFSIREVKGVKVAPSPKWLVSRLLSSGIRSINNIVDIGNYVMLLTGQPLNMYDLSKISSKSLVVKDSYEGEFVAMDEKSYQIKSGDLVVCDDTKPVCLAGIMTSLEAAVNETTIDVAVEAANFYGPSVRRASSRLGLVSESSSRFVRGINPDQAERVLNIATALLKELGEASSVSSSSSYDSLKHEPTVINTSLTYINSRLGTAFSMEEVLAVLHNDHMDVSSDGDLIKVIVPSFRIDMKEACDVSEEVIRLLGYGYIKGILPQIHMSLGGLNPVQSKKRAIRSYLRDQGISEALTYTLVGEKAKDAFSVIEKGECLRLFNPLTDERKYVRKNILPSLLEVASYNVAHQNSDVAFFEVSDIDGVSFSSSHLAIVLVGKRRVWGAMGERSYDFYDLKGLFEGILELLSINPIRLKMSAYKGKEGEFHPYRSATYSLGKQTVAVLGALHPDALKAYGLGTSAVALEVDLDALLDLKASGIKASVPPRFPVIERDLAFTINEDVAYKDIHDTVKRLDRLIKEVEVFDLYQGGNIPEGKKSMAIRLNIGSEEKTLVESEAQAVVSKVIDALRISFLAEVRS